MKKNSTSVLIASVPKGLLYGALFAALFFYALGANAQNLVVTNNNTNNLDESSLREKMKADGLSDAMINKLIAQRKELDASGRKVNWTSMKKNPSVNAACSDIGVENGWAAWQWQNGTNSGANPPVWSGAPASNPTTPYYTITSGAGIDPNTPGLNPGNPAIPVVCPGFGNNSIKVGDDCTVGSMCHQLIYPLTVTAQDINFAFAYAAVIENAGHLPTEQPFVSFCIYDFNGNPVPGVCFTDTGGVAMSGYYSVNGTGCANSSDNYKPWSIVGVNLSAYIGQTLSIVITNADCVYGGHFAYSYWDFSCNITSMMSVSASSTPDTCSNNTGTAAATVQLGTAPYSYLWSNGQTTQTITGLSSGTYTITVTDANSITATATVIVNNSMLASIYSVTPVSCFGGNNGSATPTVSGGTAPYTYVWSNMQTTQTATGLTSGTYSVVVTDASGCSATLTVPVPGSPMFTINTNYTPSSCSTCPDASAQVNANGGTPPYSYQWSSGQITSNIIGVLPGSYTVCVTDANGCTKCDSLQIWVVGVNEIFNSTVSIFPNPSPGNLFIDFGNKNFDKAKISFSDVVGRTFYETTIPASGKQALDVSGFSKGIYFLKLKTDSGIATKKIVIAK